MDGTWRAAEDLMRTPYPATDLTGGKHKREFCFCGTEIKIMINKGTGVCSERCRKQRDRLQQTYADNPHLAELRRQVVERAEVDK